MKGLNNDWKAPQTAAHYETPINILLLSEWLERERERDGYIFPHVSLVKGFKNNAVQQWKLIIKDKVS